MKDDKWWAGRGKWIDEHSVENPHIDKYVVTVEIETSFARENDGVRNAREAKEWLRHGDILEIAEGLKILKVKSAAKRGSK